MLSNAWDADDCGMGASADAENKSKGSAGSFAIAGSDQGRITYSCRRGTQYRKLNANPDHFVQVPALLFSLEFVAADNHINVCAQDTWVTIGGTAPPFRIAKIPDGKP